MPPGSGPAMPSIFGPGVPMIPPGMPMLPPNMTFESFMPWAAAHKLGEFSPEKPQTQRNPATSEVRPAKSTDIDVID